MHSYSESTKDSILDNLLKECVERVELVKDTVKNWTERLAEANEIAVLRIKRGIKGSHNCGK
ncbi:hypothetical protein PRBEI_2000960900 [Prionailurus iriomotensis]